MPLVGGGGVPISLDFQASSAQTDAAFRDLSKRADDLTKKLDELADKRGERDKSIQNQTSSVKDFAQSWFFIKSLAGDILQTAQALFELGAAGAQVARMRESFGALRTDAVGDLNALREASRGTISDMDLMLAANQAQLLGVGQNVEELSQLLEIAAFRGRAMGLSTTQAFSDMVRGIGRTSPMILDNLGIVVDAEGTYTAWAEAIGVTKDELTKQDKINALLNKTIEQGNALMEEAGGLAHDSAEEFEQARANTENLKAELQELASIALLPAVQGFNDAAEAGDDFRSQMASGNELVMMYGGNIALTRAEAQVFGERIREAADEQERATQYGLAWASALAETADATQIATEATEPYVADLEKILKLQESISDEVRNYNEDQAENLKKQDEVKAKIQELTEQGYGPWHQKIKDLQADYDELGLKYQENADKHQEAMNRIQYDLLITKLSADGLTDAEKQIADQAGLFFGVFDQGTVNLANNFDTVSQKVAEGKLKVQDMQRALELMAKGYNIDIVMNVLQNMVTIGENMVGPNRRYSTGTKGWETVPGGFPNDSYMIGLTSGERFAVIPPGGPKEGGLGGDASGVMGGASNIMIQLIIQSAVSLADRDELENVLLPAIETGVRRLQAEGKFR